jgi:competence protein ComFC
MSSAGLNVRTACSAYQVLWKVADWVFPPYCGGCGKSGSSWCPECQSKTSRIPEPVCKHCGLPTPGGKECDKCQKNPPSFDSLKAYSDYAEPLRSAIIRMKTHPDYGLGLALSNYLFDLYSRSDWEANLIIPVPISKEHSHTRGYNQTDLFAYPLALRLGIPFKSKAITRIRETRSQVGLSASERAQNVNGAFKAVPSLVQGKAILVVDDVATTGSSISACALALKDSGSGKVYGLTLARPILKDFHYLPTDV